jgi:hypothetical protein
MSREIPALDADQTSVQAPSEQENEAESEQGILVNFSKVDVVLGTDLAGDSDVLDQAVQLPTKSKVALIRKLITQLETDHIQSILEFGLREIGDRHRRGILSASVSHNTRLLLKKDYSYQERGLTQPTQYYVYLRRRKPKLDRYIGALFYIPEGCTLDYFLNAEGQIVFKPPHNLFQLRDCTNPNATQVVRLVHLQPPPPDYTFEKQHNDTPEIYLHLEYLDPKSYQPLSSETYPFPLCMYEGGQLDRYRWEVSSISPLPTTPETPERTQTTQTTQTDELPLRRVLKLPETRSLTFYFSKPEHSNMILKRMRMWVAWSEKAMPHAKWEILQSGTQHTLINAHFKRPILSFSAKNQTVRLENSLPVLIKWFHDLSLAVSQSQNQRQYTAAQLKLAHDLFVEMNLPQTDSIVVLKKLFGVDFSALSDKN